MISVHIVQTQFALGRGNPATVAACFSQTTHKYTDNIAGYVGQCSAEYQYGCSLTGQLFRDCNILGL